MIFWIIFIVNLYLARLTLQLCRRVLVVEVLR